MDDYQCDLEQIAAGNLSKIGQSYIFQGRTRHFFIEKGDLVFKDNINKLPYEKRGPTTSSGKYQMCIRSAFEGEAGDVAVIRLADPNNWINSMELANATSKVYGSSLKVINIQNYISQDKKLESRMLWSPKFQKQWGKLNNHATYLLAGFEDIDKEQLSTIFSCPGFEATFEFYQERRGFWKHENYNHKLIFLITGKAENIFDHECRKFGSGSTVGTMQNFLQRVHKQLLYCIARKP